MMIDNEEQEVLAVSHVPLYEGSRQQGWSSVQDVHTRGDGEDIGECKDHVDVWT